MIGALYGCMELIRLILCFLEKRKDMMWWMEGNVDWSFSGMWPEWVFYLEIGLTAMGAIAVFWLYIEFIKGK